MMIQTWYLVSDARNKLLQYWYVPAVLLFLFLILQSVLGRYIDNEIYLAWEWLLFQLLPISIILHASSWLQKHPTKLISSTLLRTLIYLLLLHIITALLTILLMPFALTDRTPASYLKFSFLWTAVPNLLTSIGLYLTFLRQERRLIPNVEILMQVAKQEGEKAHQKGNIKRQLCLELIANNDMLSAFEQMKSYFEPLSSDDLNHLILIQSRFKHVTQQNTMGLIDERDAQIEINKITEAILNLTKLIH